ncbi:MAG: large-conductance mechanosensitive channel protein MscL [Oscillospiraceae bacterium]|nr:large-conductance mechanosensitive channel protein MscL [Oscillospiraceae bacterium]
MIAEFKEFISRGNVMDMAVGVIIGGAFTKIVNSVVSDIITPALGLLTGNIDFADLKVVLSEAVMEGETVVKEELAIRYGVFLDALINFFLIAVCVFLMVKVINTIRTKAEELKRKEEEKAAEEAPAPAPDPQLELLTEIRDLLKNK